MKLVGEHDKSGMNVVGLGTAIRWIALIVGIAVTAGCGGGGSGGVTASGMIGPEGGKVAIPGKVILTVPKGALDVPTTLTITATGEHPKGLTLASDVYLFKPEGLEFAVQATVRFFYHPVRLPHESYGYALRVFWTDAEGAFHALESSVDSGQGTVDAAVTHFSKGAAGVPGTVCCRTDLFKYEFLDIDDCLARHEWGEVSPDSDCEPLCCQYELNSGEVFITLPDMGKCRKLEGKKVDAGLCKNVCCALADDDYGMIPVGNCKLHSGKEVEESYCIMVCCQDELGIDIRVPRGVCAGTHGQEVDDALCVDCCKLPDGKYLSLPSDICEDAKGGEIVDSSLCVMKCCNIGGGFEGIRLGECKDQGGKEADSSKCRVCCGESGDYRFVQSWECEGAGQEVELDDTKCETVCCDTSNGIEKVAKGYCNDLGYKTLDMKYCDDVCCNDASGYAFMSAKECNDNQGEPQQDKALCMDVCCRVGDAYEKMSEGDCHVTGQVEPDASKCEGGDVCCKVGSDYVTIAAGACAAQGEMQTDESLCELACCDASGGIDKMARGYCADLGFKTLDMEFCDKVCCKTDAGYKLSTEDECILGEVRADKHLCMDVCCKLAADYQTMTEGECQDDAGMPLDAPQAACVGVCCLHDKKTEFLSEYECYNLGGQDPCKALDLECGDNGCGGSCGNCPGDQVCNKGTCGHECTPDCTGRECGDDGCGGSCGTCPVNQVEQVCNGGKCEPTYTCCHKTDDTYQWIETLSECQAQGGEAADNDHCFKSCCHTGEVYKGNVIKAVCKTGGGTPVPDEVCTDIVCCDYGNDNYGTTQAQLCTIAATIVDWDETACDTVCCEQNGTGSTMIRLRCKSNGGIVHPAGDCDTVCCVTGGEKYAWDQYQQLQKFKCESGNAKIVTNAEVSDWGLCWCPAGTAVAGFILQMQQDILPQLKLYHQGGDPAGLYTASCGDYTVTGHVEAGDTVHTYIAWYDANPGHDCIAADECYTDKKVELTDNAGPGKWAYWCGTGDTHVTLYPYCQ
ncbi:MAG: hypothetical protein GXP49_06065 [Deltaproteobacteria bacterium]|nr:hypothetical protein [Deltaproteobacteria bacterium]